MSKSTLLRDYEHLVSDLGNYFDVTGDAYGPVVEHLARLERRAKDWAHNAVGNWSCNSCKRRDKNMSGPIVHAHDCDAAIILDLERESGSI